jgi:hypothetical protein
MSFIISKAQPEVNNVTGLISERHLLNITIFFADYTGYWTRLEELEPYVSAPKCWKQQ